MKTPIIFSLALLAVAPVQAQMLQPAFGGALLGAVIGHNSGSLGHNAWRGAAYGAGAGLLLGSINRDAHQRDIWYQSRVPLRTGYGHYRSPYYPSYYSRPTVAGYAGSPGYGYDFGATGAFWGGIAGAIIGHNDGRHGWAGAAYGAGAGYLLGRIIGDGVTAGRPVRYVRQPAYYETVEPAPAPAATPQQVTIINNYYAPASTPMTSANGLFGR